MKITIETNDGIIKYECQAVIGCMIKPKAEDDPESAGFVVGVGNDGEMFIRAAQSISAMIDSVFEDDPFKGIVVRALMQKMFEPGVTDVFMSSENKVNIKKPYKPDED